MKQFLLPLLLLIFLGQIKAQSIWFVDHSNTGTQTGQSWATALTNLQDAIDTAAAGDTILVAKGTYYPTTIVGGGSDNRDKSFEPKTHSRIFGGFAGSESGLSDRSNDSTSLHITNRTVLSGNIGNPNLDSDNAYHVVLWMHGNYYSILDGFEISSGRADSSSINNIGAFNLHRDVAGGIYAFMSNTTFSNCVIKYNAAKRGGAGVCNTGAGPYFDWCAIEENTVTGTYNQNANGGGGGMRNDNCDVSISNSRFYGNESYTNQGGGAIRNENGSDAIITDVIIRENYCEDGDGGGGIYNYYNSAPTLTNVSFISNSTENQGGAMYCDTSIPILSNCLFLDNFAVGGAGAIECDAQSNAELTDCQFIENSTEGDGGAIQSWQSSVVINRCLFEGNHADGDGGAIFNYNTCSPWVTNTIIRENTCDGNGGGIYNRRNCHPVLTHLLIYDNYAGIDGGGVYTVESNGEPCSPIATNLTIVRNEASNSGGGAFDDGQGDSRLRNSIILGNTALSNDEIDAPAASAATNVFYCIIGTEYYTFGTNLPTTYTGTVFYDPTNDDFHLAANSPALNAGDSSFFASTASPDISVNTEDFDGNPRVMGTNIDLGLYEVCTDTLEPMVTISVAPSDSVQDSTAVTFTSSTNVSNVLQYQWRKNGGDITGETTDTFVAMADVDFFNGDVISLLIESSEQCAIQNANTVSNLIQMEVYMVADTTDTTNNDTTNNDTTDFIFETRSAPKFNLYPNPNNTGSIKIEGDFEMGSTMSVFDITGRVVLTETVSSKSQLIDVSQLPYGAYTVTLSTRNGELASKRLIVTP